MRWKISLILSAVLLTYLGLLALLYVTYLTPRFAELERFEAIRNSKRAAAALSRELSLLDRTLNDWSSWDNAVSFVKGENPEFVPLNLTAESLAILDMDLLVFTDPKGKVIWHYFHDRSGGKTLRSAWLPSDQLPPNHPICRLTETGALSGFFAEDEHLLLLAIRPILSSTSSGPLSGHLVMGRLLKEDGLQRISEQTQAQTTLHLIEEPLPDQSAILAGLKDNPFFVRTSQGENLQVFSLLKDIMGQPLVLLQVDVGHDLMQQVEEMFSTSLLGYLVTGIGLLALSFYAAHRTLIQPLSELSRLVSQAGSDALPGHSPLLGRKDELGELARSFTDLMGEVTKDRSSRMTRSYQSGKADVAGDLLHNIKNGLHPIVAYIDLMLAEVREAPLKELDEAMQELKEPTTPSLRQMQLREFCEVGLLELVALLQEMEKTLAKVMNQTRSLVSMTDTQKRELVIAPLEEIQLSKMLHEVQRQVAEMETALKIWVDPNLTTAKPLRTQPMKLQNVLTTLVVFQSTGKAEATEVEIRQCSGPTYLKGMICIEIIHPGVAIHANDLERLFERGYTGERTHSEQGLHWVANAVNGLGGRLGVSQAFGGIVFRLELPYESPAKGDLT